MDRKKKIGILFGITVIVILITAGIMTAGATGMGIKEYLFNRTVQKTDLTAYTEELCGIKLEDICVGEMGKAESTPSEDFANICLTLNDSGAETVQARFSEKGIEPVKVSREVNHPFNSVARKLSGEETLCYYCIFKSGKGNALTRSIYIYLSRGDDGTEYLYLFG